MRFILGLGLVLVASAFITGCSTLKMRCKDKDLHKIDGTDETSCENVVSYYR